MLDKQHLTKLLGDIEELYKIHEAGVSDPTKCREFNSKASIFLETLEDIGADTLADRMMDILGVCSPKDFSPCDNRLSTKGALERLRDKIRENLNRSE